MQQRALARSARTRFASRRASPRSRAARSSEADTLLVRRYGRYAVELKPTHERTVAAPAAEAAGRVGQKAYAQSERTSQLLSR